MEKPFVLFYGSTYYPASGWHDFAGEFDTLEEAAAEGEKRRAGYQFDWWQVVDLRERKIVAGSGEGHTGLFGKVVAGS
jgi:hypothetical protein